MTQNETRIFISYSASETIIADALCTYLETRGLLCWIAPRDMELGNPFSQTIIEKIEDSYAMIVILSQTSNKSDFVFSEIGNAFQRQLPILEFRIHVLQLEKRLELYLRTRHYLDATAGRPYRHFPMLYRHCFARKNGLNIPDPPGAGVHFRPGLKRVIIPIAAGLALASLLYLTISNYFDTHPVQSAITDSPVKNIDSPPRQVSPPTGSGADRQVTHTAAVTSKRLLGIEGAVFIDGPSPELSETQHRISFSGAQGNTIGFHIDFGIYKINGKMRLTGDDLEIIQAQPACTGEMNLGNDGASLDGAFQAGSSANGIGVKLTRWKH